MVRKQEDMLNVLDTVTSRVIKPWDCVMQGECGSSQRLQSVQHSGVSATQSSHSTGGTKLVYCHNSEGNVHRMIWAQETIYEVLRWPTVNV